jgi:hypothetical protein
MCRVPVTEGVGLLDALTDARAVGGQGGRECLDMGSLLRQRQRVCFQPRACSRHLDRALRRPTHLDDALGQEIHGVLSRIDHFIEEFVQGNETRPLDMSMRLLGLVHEVNAVGEPRVAEANHVGTGLGWQIILRLVHVGCRLRLRPVGVLPVGHPPHPGM